MRADAATDFASLGDFLFLRIFEAFEATSLEVFSFFAIRTPSLKKLKILQRGFV